MENEQILLRGEVALVGDELGLVDEKLNMAISDEVKTFEGITDKSELITYEGLV